MSLLSFHLSISSVDQQEKEEELIIVTLDGSELLERLMKVFLTLPSRMQLLG